MRVRWYKNTVVYAVDVDTFRDGNGDGIGDFIGLRQGLSYLSGLGVGCLWLLPFYPSPDRDNGYDITDYLNVHPALGDLGDFNLFMDEARNLGVRVIIDLVVNHTSDQHPWFQAARTGDPHYRDYYVWRTDDPGNTDDQAVFPGEQHGVWQYDQEAKAYYFHRFYAYQPDLNTSNPAVRAEIKKIMGFWLALGVSGFRMDAAPFVIAQKGPEAEKQPHEKFELLDEFRDFVSWKANEAVLLAEANVLPDQMLQYFGPNDTRMHLVLNFFVNPHLFLALAEESAEPISRALNQLPKLPEHGQWAYFVRNHDELDLSRLTQVERERCFRRFAPKPEMRLYGRGIRRRLAPMLDGDVDWQMLAYSLTFSLPGTPVLWYGEELGMGEDLSQPERCSVRTPMQWADEYNAGFSTAASDQLRRPVIAKGKFNYHKVNVQQLRRQPESLLNRLERLIRTRKEYPEFAIGTFRILETSAPELVFAHACQDEDGSAVIAAHNFTKAACTVSIKLWTDQFDHFYYLLADRENEKIKDGAITLNLPRYGFCWVRLKTRLG
jgi:maltose alpha-D-glucosyltransferase / alpha-amylase